MKRKALLSMGYREMEKGVWGKPVGYVLLTFEENTGCWTNWFNRADGNGQIIWDHHIYLEDEDFIEWLKYHESYTRTDIRVESKMEFLTITQQLEGII